MAKMPRPGPAVHPQYGRLLPEASAFHPVYQPDDVPMIYADGTIGVNLGPNVARLILFKVMRVEPANPPREIRQVSTTIVMPANAMVEMAVNLLKGLKTNPDIEQQMKGATDALLASIKTINIAS